MIDFFQSYAFLWPAFLAGVGVAFAAGPLGCIVVWRRMAYFGDTLAHAALLGVTLGVLLNVNIFVGVLGVSLTLALALTASQGSLRITSDAMLGTLSHTALSLGIILSLFLENARLDLFAFLFGDILAVTSADILWIWGGGASALVLLAVLWRPMLALTLHVDLARVEGVPVERTRFLFILLLALVVAASLKIVGVLLITSLLIIPATAARRLARTPEGMAAIAAGIGALSVSLGLLGSALWDLPSGPSIVVAAALFFLATLVLERVIARD